MPKSIAIIVGVTDYVDPALHLPACKKDVEVIDSILRMGGRFTEVIVISSCDAQSLKANLAETVQRFKHEEIDDLLFYFTGHGEFVEDGFNYQLRDYSKSRIAATTLANAELDSMLKSLSPNLMVKVVDACYSGMPYIKDGSSFDDYIKSSNTFSNCYFLFSSQSDQRSYADENISDFTLEFAKAVAASNADSIRYKDVIDAISDAFAGRTAQRPLFVSQASFTEVFGIYSSEARKKISAFLNNGDFVDDVVSCSTETSITVAVEEPSLLDLVQRNAERYVTLARARDIVQTLKATLENTRPRSEIDSLYEISTSFFDDYDAAPNLKPLGEWVRANKEQEYFATPTFTTETYEVDDMFQAFFSKDKKTTRTRAVVSGLRTEVQGMAFVSFRIQLQPKHPNLAQYGAWLTYIISKTTIQAFFAFVEYQEVSWGDYRSGVTTQWDRHAFPLSNGEPATDIAKLFYSQFSDWAADQVRNRLARISGAEKS
jgi:hypothetical protein